MPDFKKLIARLKRHYGEPKLPPAQGPFELVMWENACYLLSDERRAAVFEGLRTQVGLDAGAIWNADRDTLLALARMGGMRPETRVFRWREWSVSRIAARVERVARAGARGLRQGAEELGSHLPLSPGSLARGASARRRVSRPRPPAASGAR